MIKTRNKTAMTIRTIVVKRRYAVTVHSIAYAIHCFYNTEIGL